MTSIYNAIMKAADHIERNPGLFNFQSNLVPNKCGTPGCALGWIGHFIGGKKQKMRFASEVTLKMGFSNDDGLLLFLYRLDGLSQSLGGQFINWHENPNRAAKILRMYAAKYHSESIPPVIPRTGIPDSVRQIFAELPGERVS